MELPESLAVIAQQQWGVATRRQILDSGISRPRVRAALGQRWRMVLPGVILLDRGLPTLNQRLMAAQLLAGPRAWLAGPTAGSCHGLPHMPAPEQLRRVEVLVPAPCRPRSISWVSIRRTHLTDERLVEHGALRLSCRARSLVDAAATMTQESHVRAAIIAAIQQRLVRAQDVAHWIEARQPNGRTRLRAALSEAMAGIWSVPEGDLVRLLGRSKVLPPVMANPELRDAQGRRLTTPDVWIDDVAMAVMVHSRQFHEEGLDWEATVESDADLASARVIVVPVTPGSIARDPARVLHRVEQAYQQAKSHGVRAPVVATPGTDWLAAS